MISAKVICDSISPSRKRITTMELIYPRFIHAEFMTHRVFSRNAASSRAIPTKKLIERIKNDPAMPVYWGKNQSGMQAKEELDLDSISEAKANWLNACWKTIEFVETLEDLKVHKQITNRLLEPWMYITTIVTATEWDNFYFLRRDSDAQPEIQALANAMWLAHQNARPLELKLDQWHLPYIIVNPTDPNPLDIEILKKCSVARCARVSYLTHDGAEPSVEKDLALFSKLVERDNPDKPGHWSPLEHIARPLFDPDEQSGNFYGWFQMRKEFSNENRST